MPELVILKNDDIFTNSMIIAKGTDNEHKSVVSLIKKYKSKFEKFGNFRFSDLKSTNPKGGRPTRIYFLNEPQATLLITFLDNTDIVVDFKVELVKQFYQMRQLLLEKQTQMWKETRKNTKTIRIEETSWIKKFVEYAKSQGSKNADKYYINFSRLANKAAGVNSKARDMANTSRLNNLALTENMIISVIRDGIHRKIPYKSLYQNCKRKVNIFFEA